MTNVEVKKIGFALFQDYASIDVMGPLQVLGSMARPRAEIYLIADTLDLVRSIPVTRLQPDKTFADALDLDVLIVPGGAGVSGHDLSDAYREFVRSQAGKVDYLVSVCTGALILRDLGLLDGKVATTHWAALGALGRGGGRTAGNGITVAGGYPRYVVESGSASGHPKTILTSGGLSSGIDLAFALVALLAGADEARGVQLALQYAPDPPYPDGDPAHAAPDVFSRAFEVLGHLSSRP